MDGCAVLFLSVNGIRIGYIRSTVCGRHSTAAAPVTGSLVFFDTFARLYGYCAAEYTSSWLFCGTVCDSLCGHGLLISLVDLCLCKTMEGAALVDDHTDIIFDVELCIPWDAPESIVDIYSVGVVPLGSVPDVVGLFGRRPNAAASRILQGRDSRSIRFLVPDSRGVDQNFHDVTVVDMGVVPETKVSFTELSLPRDEWPQAIFKHMTWHQQQLELMRKEAKKRFRQIRPSPCRYCGKVIRCDMYRHVAMFHLDLAQLWRCPISWCTVWKGTPQDCMDHLRGAHDVPWISKTANMEKYVPPWTVRREMWTDALRRTLCYLVTSACRWHTTTRYIDLAFHMSHSIGITWRGSALCCLCRQFCP